MRSITAPVFRARSSALNAVRAIGATGAGSTVCRPSAANVRAWVASSGADVRALRLDREVLVQPVEDHGDHQRDRLPTEHSLTANTNGVRTIDTFGSKRADLRPRPHTLDRAHRSDFVVTVPLVAEPTCSTHSVPKTAAERLG